jgi:hypothetical protein
MRLLEQPRNGQLRPPCPLGPVSEEGTSLCVALHDVLVAACAEALLARVWIAALPVPPLFSAAARVATLAPLSPLCPGGTTLCVALLDDLEGALAGVVVVKHPGGSTAVNQFEHNSIKQL